jgi:hypothetical protein
MEMRTDMIAIKSLLSSIFFIILPHPEKTNDDIARLFLRDVIGDELRPQKLVQ